MLVFWLVILLRMDYPNLIFQYMWSKLMIECIKKLSLRNQKMFDVCQMLGKNNNSGESFFLHA